MDSDLGSVLRLDTKLENIKDFRNQKSGLKTLYVNSIADSSEAPSANFGCLNSPVTDKNLVQVVSE